ncbi:MAG: VWA domain-containing protein [Kiritimatiellae bacterium]|nr:VWA domain-containing protein [Kiritimatiellia bacterium]
MDNANSLTPWSGRLHPRNLYAAVAGVVVSLLVHILVLRNFPSLPVGKPADVDLMRRLRPLELGDVRPRAVRAMQRPSVFRPADPGRLAENLPAPGEMEDALREVLPESPDLSAAPLAGEESALAEPPVEEREVWEGRADVLQINERILADEVSALPRWYVPETPREATAPDITLPAERPEDEPDLSVARLAAGEGRGPDGLRGVGIPSALGTAEAVETEVESEGRREASALLDEKPAEITAVEPIEDLLTLDVQAYRPPDEAQVYFAIHIKRRSDEVLPVLPKDVLLIQDCSESMTQRKLENCKAGLHRWLERLGPDDRFNIMGFREEPYLCFEDWQAVTPAAKARARGFIEQMVSRGRTDVYASLQGLLGMTRKSARPVIAVLVTDGRPTAGVLDSAEIIEGFTDENSAGRSVFCVGAGQRVNRFLLDLLSYKNRGDSLIVADRRELPERMDGWAKTLGRPVLADLEYRFAGPDGLEVYPRTLTHLYLDRPLTVYGRVPAEEAMAFQILGASGDRQHDMVFRLDWTETGVGDEKVRTQWAWHKIYDLIGRHLKTGSPAIMRQIQSIASRYGLRVPYASDTPLR